MTYDEIFEQYYNLYRAEATTPDSSDDEYTIGMRFANNAILRWEKYDNTFWKELFTDTSLDKGGATVTTTAGTASYRAPELLRVLGGNVRLLDSNGKIVKRIPVLEPQEVQFKNEHANFVYLTGNNASGRKINFNVAPDQSGLTIEYDYYKAANLITDGSSVPEMSNPDFMIDHMLSSRFRSSRNPYYGTAKRDAEAKLGQMKMENDSGTWANPWSVPDRSGSVWGGEGNASWSF